MKQSLALVLFLIAASYAADCTPPCDVRTLIYEADIHRMAALVSQEMLVSVQ
jgi:hypothetical protein